MPSAFFISKRLIWPISRMRAGVLSSRSFWAYHQGLRRQHALRRLGLIDVEMREEQITLGQHGGRGAGGACQPWRESIKNDGYLYRLAGVLLAELEIIQIRVDLVLNILHSQLRWPQPGGRQMAGCRLRWRLNCWKRLGLMRLGRELPLVKA